MKAFRLIAAGAVIFCLGTMSAAEPTDQGTAKKKDNSGQRATSTRNQGKLTVGVDDAHSAKSGGDSHTRIVSGNDQGIWRSGKNNQKDQKKQAQADEKLMRGKKTETPQTTGKTQQVTTTPQKLKTSAGVTTSGKPTPGATAQPQPTTAIGIQAGQNVQGQSAVAIGNQAPQNSQGQSAVAIGNQTPQNSPSQSAVAIGIQSSAGGSQSSGSAQPANTIQTTTSAGGSQSSGSAQPANTIQTTTSAGGSQSSGSVQPATTIQTTTAVGGSQSSGSAQPTIPLGGQTGAPALNTNAQSLGGLIQINPSPTP